MASDGKKSTGVANRYYSRSYQSDEPLALVVPGRYKAKCVGLSAGNMFGRQKKLILDFALIDPPGAYGQILSRYYNCDWQGTQKRPKHFRVGWRSELMREYVICFGPVKQKNHLRVDKFLKQIFNVRVKTVERDSKQRPMVQGLEYSVITEVVGLTEM